MSGKRAVIVSRLLAAACAPGCVPAAAPVARPPAAQAQADQDRPRTAAFARAEDDAMDWIVTADPRLALRADATGSDAVIKRIGLEAVLAEDSTAQIHGGALDLFAFRARAHALDHAAQTIADFKDPLPEAGPLGSGLARPRLERELVERLIAEERARAGEEAPLADASGDLVRGIISTWTRPVAPQDWLDRDAWVSRHLLEMREGLRKSRPLTGPSDLDAALYPLERLLEPAQFPRGSAAIAEVRMALDDDMRAVPKLDLPDRLARAARVHLGVTLEPTTLRPRLERLEGRLRAVATGAIATSGATRSEVEARARELLLVEGPCLPVPDSRVRSMAPSEERAAICGILRALAEEPSHAAALVALHDDVVLSFAAVVAFPPRAQLLSRPEDEDAETLQRSARERPIPALGVALAAELLYVGSGGDDTAGHGADERLRAWRALGEAPLDVVARELGGR